MLFPNKLFTYSESVISKFSIVLQSLENRTMSIGDLYKKLNRYFNGVSEFMDVMDCLYALGKIEFNEEGMIYYVKGDCL